MFHVEQRDRKGETLGREVGGRPPCGCTTLAGFLNEISTPPRAILPPGLPSNETRKVKSHVNQVGRTKEVGETGKERCA